MAANIPSITCDDLAAFHAKHFATHDFNAITASDFLTTPYNATEAEATSYEDFYDDELGYYPDGVKRTLTDEQIAIFRHSEIQALLRQKKLEEEASGSNKGVEDAKDDHMEYETRGQADVVASNSHSAVHNIKGEQERRPRPKQPNQTDDTNGRIDRAPNSPKPPMQDSLNGAKASQQKLKQTGKTPADFRRRLVSYVDS
ncbi:hypothetical protein FQN49_002519 [Arthroderma sp. PD_2]|nr:hypothetical protein FQN49_002519 [Arthroderma sp. PD_2]